MQLSYEPGIGDVSDTYTLYINPETHLIDRFYFTVMEFGITDPILMEVDYKQFKGVKLPVTRKFSAVVPNIGTMNIVEVMIDLKFNNGFDKTTTGFTVLNIPTTRDYSEKTLPKQRNLEECSVIKWLEK